MLCFRLYFAKNSTTINTAGATVRQLVYLVFERVVAEDDQNSKSENPQQRATVNFEDLKMPSGSPPKGNMQMLCLSYSFNMLNNLRFTTLCWGCIFTVSRFSSIG